MSAIAIIGGSGLAQLESFSLDHKEVIETPWGEPSAPLFFGSLAGRQIIFLPRHGADHSIPPHKINYKANIWALNQAGVTEIVAIAAVGGIHADAQPASLVIPDQVIDYSWGRASTFFEDPHTPVTHIDFSWPYSQKLREQLIDAANNCSVPNISHGVYGCTQGPRLETAAEITRMERDGCTLVGMTGMPEACLARELDIDYACCAVVANMAAGKTDQPISMAEIEKYLRTGIRYTAQVLSVFLAESDKQQK
ncbi:MAG TPA: S-methyl-5'-thioinosine phosphorylase [Crenotrichaceae bacterium]|nr:S-methyl-5'-thioinosine phosphorylase [Crenotrichaceae bacterium]